MSHSFGIVIESLVAVLLLLGLPDWLPWP